jgi:hypothetical protein
MKTMQQKISKFFLDQSPRQAWRFLNKKLFRHASLASFDDQHPCVFVLSTGRTGTETMAALLSLARNVVSLHEPLPKLYGFSRIAYEHFSDPVAQEMLTEVFSSLREELLNMSLESGLGYVETSPQVTFFAPAIFAACPNARFIHLVRDPREVVRSGMRRKWFDGHMSDKYRITPLVNSPAASRWGSYNPFQKILWLWSETNQWISHFLAALPPQNKVMLHSEDVFSGDPDTIHKLFDFINSPAPSNEQIKRLLGKKLNAQTSGTFPTSSNWTSEMQRDLKNIAGETALKLGYSL